MRTQFERNGKQYTVYSQGEMPLEVRRKQGYKRPQEQEGPEFTKLNSRRRMRNLVRFQTFKRVGRFGG